MKKVDLTQGNIGKVLLLFILPLMLGSLIQQLYVMIDAVIVGQYVGKNGLAAIDSVHTLFKFPINFMNGMSAGVTILVSKYFGAKDKDGIYDSIQTALLISLGLGVTVSLFGVAFTPSFLRIMSVPQAIYYQAESYTKVYFAGLTAIIIYNMFAAILRAMGDTKRPLYILIGCAGLNIAGDYVLVSQLGMGTTGAALATILSQGISAVLAFCIVIMELRQDGDGRKIRLQIVPAYLWKMLKVGFPLALQSILFPLANTMVQASVNTLGTNDITAWGVCDKADMLIWLIADAMGPALTTYVAQNIGAGQYERVKRGVRIGTLLSVTGVAIVSLVLYSKMGEIGAWFLVQKDAAVIVPISCVYMKTMAFFFIFYAIGEALSGACCSMGNTIVPMLITLVSMCLLRMLAIEFIFPKMPSMQCVVWIYVISWITYAICFFILYIIRHRKFFSCTFANTSLQ